jgi:hypothetical protein
MHQTIKHLCIFLVFLIAVRLWYDARETLAELFPREIRHTGTILLWSSAVVAIFHLLYHYLGKMNERAIYITAAAALVASLLYYEVIDVF